MSKKVGGDKGLIYFLIITVALFVLGRYLGQYLFDNNWSFIHWQFLPGWYGPLWIIVLAAVGLVFYRRSLLDNLVNWKWIVPAAMIVLAALLWFCRFDSFLYGGGNLRVAQIGQADRIILRWFEFGSIFLAKVFFELFSALNFKANEAGAASWTVIGLLAAALSAVAAWLIAARLGSDKVQRGFLFLVIFFGPQTLLYFGFVGVEPLMVAVTLWFLLGSLRLADRWSAKNLLWVWGVLMAGVCLQVSTLFLLPAAVLITLSGSSKGVARLGAGLTGAAIAFVALTICLYYFSETNLELRTHLIFPVGTPPLVGYGLFSPRHLGDLVQILFLAAPLIVLAFYLRITGSTDSRTRLMVFTTCLAQLGGLVVIIVQNPLSSMPFDFPRFTAYLAPSVVLLAVMLARAKEAPIFQKRLLPWSAAFMLLLPFATLPSYTQIDKADPYLTAYLDKNDKWYRYACYTFRDAYFGRRSLGQQEVDKANSWEFRLPSKSPDYFNLRGCYNIMMQGDNEEAIRQLYYQIAKDPYWTEPRSLLVGIQLKLSRFDRAKPQIDTCLMLEPYNPDHHIMLYSYYRSLQDLPVALQIAERSAALFPKNKEIATDRMLLTYRTGGVSQALKMADELHATDPSLPFPYLVKAFAEDKSGNLQQALTDYRAFLAKQKDQPETLMVNQRIEQLTAPAPQK